VQNVNGAWTPLAKNLEEIASAYDNIPYEGPVTPSNGPCLDLPVDVPNLFQNEDIEDQVTNWTWEELQKVLPIETKTTMVKKSGTCRVETTRPIPGLSQQQSFTYTQDEDFQQQQHQPLGLQQQRHQPRSLLLVLQIL
jgi:hypothetical protein